MVDRRRFSELLGGAALAVMAGAPRIALAKRNPTVAATLPSGGLGLTGKQWKQLFGKPGKPDQPLFYQYSYKEQGHVVELYGLGNNDQVQRFDITFDNPVAATLAESVASQYLPRDASKLDSGPLDEISSDILWHSDWLATSQVSPSGPQDNDSLWINSNPGDFVAIFQSKNPGEPISTILFALGNNP